MLIELFSTEYFNQHLELPLECPGEVSNMELSMTLWSLWSSLAESLQCRKWSEPNKGVDTIFKVGGLYDNRTRSVRKLLCPEPALKSAISSNYFSDL